MPEKIPAEKSEQVKRLVDATELSRATVYTALSKGPHAVSEKTWTRIVFAAKKLAIELPKHQKNMPSQRPVSIILRTSPTNVWYAKLIGLLEKCLRQSGYFPLLTVLDGKDDRVARDEFTRYLDDLIEFGIRGVIAGPIHNQKEFEKEWLARLEKANVPVVAFNAEEPLQGMYSFSTDIAGGSQEAVTLLLEKGHRNIAYAGFSKTEFDLTALPANIKKDFYISRNNLIATCPLRAFFLAMRAQDKKLHTRMTGIEAALSKGVTRGLIQLDAMMTLFPWQQVNSTLCPPAADSFHNKKTRWSCGFDAVTHLLKSGNENHVSVLLCTNAEAAQGARRALNVRVFDLKGYNNRFKEPYKVASHEGKTDEDATPTDYIPGDDIYVAALKEERKLFPNNLTILGYDDYNIHLSPVVATMGETLTQLSESLVDKLDTLLKTDSNRFPRNAPEPVLIPVYVKNKHYVEEIIKVPALAWLMRCLGDSLVDLGLDNDAADAEFEKIITAELTKHALWLEKNNVADKPNRKPVLVNVMGLPSREKDEYVAELRQDETYSSFLFISFSRLMQSFPYYVRDLKKFLRNGLTEQTAKREAFERWEKPAREAGYRLFSRAVENRYNILFVNSNSTFEFIQVYDEIMKEEKTGEEGGYGYHVEIRRINLGPEAVSGQYEQCERYFPPERLKDRWANMNTFCTQWKKRCEDPFRHIHYEKITDISIP